MQQVQPIAKGFQIKASTTRVARFTVNGDNIQIGIPLDERRGATGRFKYREFTINGVDTVELFLERMARLLTDTAAPEHGSVECITTNPIAHYAALMSRPDKSAPLNTGFLNPETLCQRHGIEVPSGHVVHLFSEFGKHSIKLTGSDHESIRVPIGLMARWLEELRASSTSVEAKPSVWSRTGS